MAIQSTALEIATAAACLVPKPPGKETPPPLPAEADEVRLYPLDGGYKDHLEKAHRLHGLSVCGAVLQPEEADRYL